MNVPFLDLKSQFNSIRREVDVALREVMENTAFAGGKYVAAFEQEFANFCNAEHAIGVGSGTDALWAAMVACSIGTGDEVITVPNTFIATAESISFTGATPVFVDVDPKTLTMDPNQIEKAITSKTKAIIPVHLYGQPADMDPIMEIARIHGLVVIEDACQAHGAKYKGVPVGSIGDAGCFSFYPGKNLGAYGEAGAVVTNSDAIAEVIRMFRDHGQRKKYYHSIVGWNARMDGFQGAVLSVKMKYIEAWNDSRRDHAAQYSSKLADEAGFTVPYEADYARHVYHIYSAAIQNRDEFIEYMKERGISCGIHYPVPVHLQDAYAFLGYKEGSFPVAEKSAAEQVSLPMFPELTEEQIDYTIDAIKKYVAQRPVLSVAGNKA